MAGSGARGGANSLGRQLEGEVTIVATLENVSRNDVRRARVELRESVRVAWSFDGNTLHSRRASGVKIPAPVAKVVWTMNPLGHDHFLTAVRRGR